MGRFFKDFILGTAPIFGAALFYGTEFPFAQPFIPTDFIPLFLRFLLLSHFKNRNSVPNSHSIFAAFPFIQLRNSVP